MTGPAAQLGGVLAVGVVLMLVGLAVQLIGARVIDAVMPPVVTGAVVALIGLNLAPTAAGSFQAQPLIAAVTLLGILLATVIGPGMIGRLGILIGVVIGWVFAAITAGSRTTAWTRCVTPRGSACRTCAGRRSICPSSCSLCRS